MATGPKFPETPLELLSPRCDIEEPWMNKIWGPTICGSLTFMAICIGNYATKRPMLSGIQKHIIWTTIAAGAGKYIDDYRKDYFAERDAILRHYITLHPEDFPAFERKKYATILEPWYPIR